MTVQVSLDVYPARVEFPDGSTLNKARVILADGKLYVFVSDTGTPKLYFEEPMSSITGATPRLAFRAATESGEVSVRKAGGCGCGSRLKTFNPFPGQTRVRVAL